MQFNSTQCRVVALGIKINVDSIFDICIQESKTIPTPCMVYYICNMEIASIGIDFGIVFLKPIFQFITWMNNVNFNKLNENQ